MPEFRITSSKVHPGQKMKEGAWHFLRSRNAPARLLHKFGSRIYEFIVSEPVKKQKWWVELHTSPASISPGGSAATLAVVNFATIAYLLNATNEYLYWDFDMHDNWDGNSDVVIKVEVALSGDETVDDTIDAEIIAEYFGDHDDIDTGVKTQTSTIAHDIVSDNTQGKMHCLCFILEWDKASNVIERGDLLNIRFRLSSVASVGAVWFLGAHIQYQSRYDWPADKVLGAYPVEG